VVLHLTVVIISVGLTGITDVKRSCCNGWSQINSGFLLHITNHWLGLDYVLENFACIYLGNIYLGLHLYVFCMLLVLEILFWILLLHLPQFSQSQIPSTPPSP